MEAQNAFAGQGAVLLDIGGEIGALVVHMPAELEGVEIAIRPVGNEGGHHHDDDHDHDDGHHHHPHVAVVARPTGAGLRPSVVFGELPAGEYELYERLGGQARLSARVVGGEVTEARWPS